MNKCLYCLPEGMILFFEYFIAIFNEFLIENSYDCIMCMLSYSSELEYTHTSFSFVTL